jgi:crossover junction endodeoxyribonuclease RuvC
MVVEKYQPRAPPQARWWKSTSGDKTGPKRAGRHYINRVPSISPAVCLAAFAWFTIALLAIGCVHENSRADANWLAAVFSRRERFCRGLRTATCVFLMRIIAIDPSLRSTGYAVLEKAGQKARALEYGVIKNGDKLRQSQCLVAIRDRVTDLVIKHEPAAAAIEGVIYVQSVRTAITLGAARGAALLALAERGVPVFEYAPRRVKQSVVGRGGAQKAQVGFMVRALLGLTENPPDDAADAIAIGLTHFQMQQGAAQGVSKLSQL